MKKVPLIIVVAVLVSVSFLGGLAVGNRWTFGWMNGVLATEVRGNAITLIEMLSFVRLGETDRATSLMELRVSSAVTSLPQERQWAQIPEHEREVLVLVKKYFARYPPAEPPDSLTKVLAWIPDEPLDPNSCSPAVRELLVGG